MWNARTSGCVVAQGESKSIGTTLRDSLREQLLLALGRPLNLGVSQVSSLQLLSESVQSRSLDQIDGIDDVTERLGHLPAFRVTNEPVAVDLAERHLVGQDDTQQNHSSDPEEQDVPTGLEEAGRVEAVHIRSLLGPALDGEWPETGREPGIQDVVILLDSERSPIGDLLGSLHRVLLAPLDDPVLIVRRVWSLAIDDEQPSRTPVSPPQLSRDAPVLHVPHPSIPIALRTLGQDLQLSSLGTLGSFSSGILQVDPPLRLHDALDDIARFATDGDLHRVVLGLNVEALLLQCIQNSLPDVISLHSLELLSGVLVVGTVVVHQVDKLEVVPLSAFVIVGVVSGSDLDGSGSESHVDGDVIGNDGESSVDERVFDVLSDQVLSR